MADEGGGGEDGPEPAGLGQTMQFTVKKVSRVSAGLITIRQGKPAAKPAAKGPPPKKIHGASERLYKLPKKVEPAAAAGGEAKEGETSPAKSPRRRRPTDPLSKVEASIVERQYKLATERIAATNLKLSKKYLPKPAAAVPLDKQKLAANVERLYTKAADARKAALAGATKRAGLVLPPDRRLPSREAEAALARRLHDDSVAHSRAIHAALFATYTAGGGGGGSPRAASEAPSGRGSVRSAPGGSRPRARTPPPAGGGATKLPPLSR